MELSPQLRQLRDFYYKTGLKLPPEKDFVRGERVIDRPAFFTLEHLRTHLNNPLLRPEYFKIYWQGKVVDCSRAMGHKVVQGDELPFLNKGIIEEYLANGAAVVLEAIDIFEPMINAMCAAIDAAGEAVLSNSVAFFSQAKGGEAYRGHVDTADVLVVQLAGRKRWFVHERQKPRWIDLHEMEPPAMGPVQAEFVMEPGDVIYLRSYTPHRVETADDFSLHMAFDICDRRINADTALHLLLQRYNTDAAPTYTPTPEVVDKLIAQAQSKAYRDGLAELGAAQAANYKRARALFGANRVTALDALIAREATRRK
ncbi:MAG: hypothetical protein JNM90_23840 [Burkholderiales bacterium]|nr:hypothetical protein [Burkholderiales bacterium]